MTFKNTKLLIGTPMYGGMCHGSYTLSMLNAVNYFNKIGLEHDFCYVFNNSLITKARNDIVKFFLDQTNYTHLLFIDSDINFNPIDIIKMLEADKEIICGLYPLKEINWDTVKIGVYNNIPNDKLKAYTGSFTINLKNNAKTQTINIETPFEILNGGTGFMLIQREVFNKLKDKCPSYKHEPFNIIKDEHINYIGEVTEYFATSIDPILKTMYSEDYHFCKLARENNISVWAAPWALLGHTGSYCYEGRPIPSKEIK